MTDLAERGLEHVVGVVAITAHEAALDSLLHPGGHTSGATDEGDHGSLQKACVHMRQQRA